MIVCPVCEHQQPAGSECEVCGRRLAEGLGTDPPVPALEGLETTVLAGGDQAVAVAPIPDLEATHHAPVLALPGSVPDVEPTRAAPVEVLEETVPDLERTQAGLPDDGPTPLPALPTCRYCRTPAFPGERLCSRCGMRLPVVAGAAPAAPEAARRYCSCGVPVTGSLCPSCGARNGGG
jgi:hypothetical protein